MSGSTGWQPLLPHPDSVAEATRVAFSVRIVPEGDRRLRFEYRAGVRLGTAQAPVQLRLPRQPARAGNSLQAEDGRTAGLWRETCCEAFVHMGDEPGYLEFNFSPSGLWAAYAFSAYRTGMRDLAMRAPRIECRSESSAAATEELVLVSGFELQAEIELPDSRWLASTRAGSLDFALTAVLKLGRQGPTTYWSLRHPPGKPDFHDRANFALTLPASTAASS